MFFELTIGQRSCGPLYDVLSRSWAGVTAQEGIAVLADLGTQADRRIRPGGGVKGAQMWAVRGAIA